MTTLVYQMQQVLDEKGSGLTNETRRILLKEAVQGVILNFIYNHPVFRRLNFYGGTCLHVLYQLNRLSEDIDLDNTNRVDLDKLPQGLLTYFHLTIKYPKAAITSQISSTKIYRMTLKLPVLYELKLSTSPNEALHVKVEISQHTQIAVIQQTPVFYLGRSFVPSHFSLETMMAGKMLACLERNFQKGKRAVFIKGRDFYDLLWFMQKKIHPLEKKLEKEGCMPYSEKTAMLAIKKKVDNIKISNLAVDLIPLFESRTFVDAWLESFHDTFNNYLKYYVQ